MKSTLNTLFFLLIIIVNAQVGIGTITPNASAKLDINATNKGILIPRVSLANTNILQLDGINNAVDGLLIYNTNTSIINGNGAGFYYFDNNIWQNIITTKLQTAKQNVYRLNNVGNFSSGNIFINVFSIAGIVQGTAIIKGDFCFSLQINRLLNVSSLTRNMMIRLRFTDSNGIDYFYPPNNNGFTYSFRGNDFNSINKIYFVNDLPPGTYIVNLQSKRSNSISPKGFSLTIW